MTDITNRDNITIRDKKGGIEMREYLIGLRTKIGLTQQEVANKLLISQNYLSLIESGNRQEDLKLSTIKGFSKVYDVTVEYLIQQEIEYQNYLKAGNKE